MIDGYDTMNGKLTTSMIIILFSFTLLPFATAQEIIEIAVRGQCGEFMVSVMASGLYDENMDNNECWDAKLDIPGRIFDHSAGDSGEWMSSFYYIDDALCPPEQEVVITLKPSSIAPTIEGTAKLRQGNNLIEKPFTIEQDCPQPLGWEWVLLAAIMVVVFFGYLIVWWMRHK